MNRDFIVKGIYGLSKVYQSEITDQLLDVWKDTLADLTEEEFSRACKKYLLSDNAFFPKPGQIYKIARPTPDVEPEAMMIVEKIFELLGPCGSDIYGVDRANNALGEIGKAYISIRGGWAKFSDSMKLVENESIGTLKAQAKQAIIGLLTRKRSDMPLLPEAEPAGLVSLGSFLKTVTRRSTDASDQTSRSGEAHHSKSSE